MKRDCQKKLPRTTKERSRAIEALADRVHKGSVVPLRNNAWTRLDNLDSELRRTFKYTEEGHIRLFYSPHKYKQRVAIKRIEVHIHGTGLSDLFVVDLEKPLRPIIKISSKRPASRPISGADPLTSEQRKKIFELLYEAVSPRVHWRGKWWYDTMHETPVRPIFEGEWDTDPPCKSWEAWSAEDIA